MGRRNICALWIGVGVSVSSAPLGQEPLAGANPESGERGWKGRKFGMKELRDLLLPPWALPPAQLGFGSSSGREP